MPQHPSLKQKGLHIVFGFRIFPGQLLHRREAATFRSVLDCVKYQQRPGKTYDSGHEEAPFPAPAGHHCGGDYEGYELPEIRTGGENAVPGASGGGGEPSGEVDDSGSRAHRLEPSVQAPQNQGYDKEYRMRQTCFCTEQTGKSYEQIHQGRCQKAETHKPAYIAIVGDETVQKFAEGVNQQQSRAYESQLPCGKHPCINHRLFNHPEAHTADVIDAVSDSCSPERGLTKPAIDSILFVGIHLDRRRLAYPKKIIYSHSLLGRMNYLFHWM